MLAKYINRECHGFATLLWSRPWVREEDSGECWDKHFPQFLSRANFCFKLQKPSVTSLDGHPLCTRISLSKCTAQIFCTRIFALFWINLGSALVHALESSVWTKPNSNFELALVKIHHKCSPKIGRLKYARATKKQNLDQFGTHWRGYSVCNAEFYWICNTGPDWVLFRANF